MAKFKCQHTGNIVEFTTEHDILTMQKHTEYTEVLDAPLDEPVAAPAVKTRKQATPTTEE
jgi:hypothetical protein